MSDFDDLLDEGVDNVFFEDFGESITRGDDSLRVIFDSGVETISEDGTMDMVSHAIITKKGDLTRGDTFTRDKDSRSWALGRLLSRDPDDRVQTYEVTPD